ncbi:hypothetical protein JR316_0004866 [Psilocybe cubensis]|nr:hypothetical protein JR316_0004866 [Psilocybe cubensis]KAH9482766.1 hypothetical protein JR316_0004866 [Psilocybe cubensis]
MIDSAQSWLTIVMPMLSRNEPLPTLKAAIRLLRVVFTKSSEITEFQRQICLPNVVKFTHAVIAIADNHNDLEVKILCLNTLSCVIKLYPTAHRASNTVLSALALRHLSGSSQGPTSSELLEAASGFFAVLPLTGGKVGAINLWRKSFDETLAFGLEAFHALRTTFPIGGPNVPRPILVDEPQVAIPLNQDRLHCSVVTLQKLLSAPVQRTVQLPMGSLVKFIDSLIGCSMDEEVEGFIDPSVRSMEVSIVSEIWNLGYQLLASVAEQFKYRLDPHATRLLSIIAFRLEQKLDGFQRLCLLNALDSLLNNCHTVDSTILPIRLAKSALYSITKILSSSNRATNQVEPSSSQKKNGKKRSRNFEGDEVFKVTRPVIYASKEDSDALLVSIDVVQSLLRNPHLSSSMQSIIARLITSVLMTLPRMSFSTLSGDPTFFELVSAKIQRLSFRIGSGTTSVMSKTLPFVIEAALANSNSEIQHDIGMLIHPRVPPLVRSMPHIEALSLFKVEESLEETENLSSLGIANIHLHPHQIDEQRKDVSMEDSSMPEASILIDSKQTVHHVPHSEGILTIDHEDSTFVSCEENESQKNAPPIELANFEDTSKAIPASSTKFPTLNHTAQGDMAPNLRSIAFTVDDDEQDEDKDMPVIDMDSDSEDEDD